MARLRRCKEIIAFRQLGKPTPLISAAGQGILDSSRRRQHVYEAVKQVSVLSSHCCRHIDISDASIRRSEGSDCPGLTLDHRKRGGVSGRLRSPETQWMFGKWYAASLATKSWVGGMINPWIYATKSGTQKNRSLPKEVRGSGGPRSHSRCCWGRFVRLHGDPWYVPGSLPAAPAFPSAAHVCEGEGGRDLPCNVFGGIRVGGTCPATVRIPSHNMITCRGVWGSGRPVFRGAGGPIHSPFTCGSGTWEGS